MKERNKTQKFCEEQSKKSKKKGEKESRRKKNFNLRV